jgi:hypothetical protein
MPKRDYIRATPVRFPRRVLNALRKFWGLSVRILEECGAVDRRIEQRKSHF